MSNTQIANLQRKISLSDFELQVIVGCILGDGNLCRSGKNYRLRIEHKAEHWEYVKQQIFDIQKAC